MLAGCARDLLGRRIAEERVGKYKTLLRGPASEPLPSAALLAATAKANTSRCDTASILLRVEKSSTVALADLGVEVSADDGACVGSFASRVHVAEHVARLPM
eukprot:2367872-Pyramimonas_sp.AAC.1